MTDRVIVNPTGPINSKIAIVLEAPGPKEHEAQTECNRGRSCRGKCLGHTAIGATGLTLNAWLQRAGIPRTKWHVRNTVQHYPNYLGDRTAEKPTPAEVAADLPVLLNYLQTYKPKVVLALGQFAVEALLGETEYIDILHKKKFGMPALNGRPCIAHESRSGCVVIPGPHPAAGLRDSHAAVQTWLAIKSGCKFILENHTLDSWFGPEIPTKFKVVRGAAAVKKALATWDGSFDGTPADTEGYPDSPHSLQFSTRPGLSFVIMADDKEGLEYFFKHAPRPLEFHNLLYDWDMVKALIKKHGIDISLSIDEFADSMIKVYVTAKEIAKGKAESDEFSLIGQGLKCLTYKYFGHKMQTLDDLFEPVKEKVTRQYIEKVAAASKGPDQPLLISKEDNPSGEGCINTTGGGVWANTFPPIKKERTKAQGVKLYRQFLADNLTGFTPYLLKASGQMLLCDCKSGKKHTCHAKEIAKAVAALPGKLNPPSVKKRAQSLYKRVQSILSKPEVVKKWQSLLKTNPSWVEPIVEYCGPLPEATVADLDPDAFNQYSAEDPDYGGRLGKMQSAEIKRLGVEKPYQFGMQIIPMLSAMTEHGIYVNQEKLRQLEAELNDKAGKLYCKLRKIAWDHGLRDFNPGSNDDIAALLFGAMKVATRGVRLTATGKPTTDEKGLASLKLTGVSAKFRELLFTYKELQKLLGTYVRPMPTFIKSDGRIHLEWRNTVTVSGRLASSDRMLTMPKRSDLGLVLRDAFEPAPGYVFLDCDLSQVELRVLASEARDKAMMRAFNTGVDLHDETTKRVFGIDQTSPEWDRKRDLSKTVNFGCAYGLASQGLQMRLAMMGITGEGPCKIEEDWDTGEQYCVSLNCEKHGNLKECEFLVKEKQKEWPEAFAFLKSVGDECAAHPEAIARDMWGRIRFLPLIWSPVKWAQAEARRQAANLAIQGGAQGVEQLGMIKWWAEIQPKFPLVKPLMQVHDAVMFEVPEDQLDEVKKLTVECFETAAQDRFVVPIKADAKWGKSWGSMKKFK